MIVLIEDVSLMERYEGNRANKLPPSNCNATDSF